MKHQWNFTFFKTPVSIAVSIGEVTLEQIIDRGREMGRANRKGEVGLVAQVHAYRDIMGGDNRCTLTDARDYVWKLNGRPLSHDN